MVPPNDGEIGRSTPRGVNLKLAEIRDLGYSSELAGDGVPYARAYGKDRSTPAPFESVDVQVVGWQRRQTSCSHSASGL